MNHGMAHAFRKLRKIHANQLCKQGVDSQAGERIDSDDQPQTSP